MMLLGLILIVIRKECISIFFRSKLVDIVIIAVVLVTTIMIAR
jgi:hypothetical protein